VERHKYSEAEIAAHLSGVKHEGTRFLLQMVMENLHIEEKWLDYLKDMNQHFLYKTYFVAAVQENMPEEYLKVCMHADCVTLDYLIEKKNAYFRMCFEKERNEQNAGGYLPESEQLAAEVEFYKTRVSELLGLYSDYSPFAVINPFKELQEEKIALNKELKNIELEKQLQIINGCTTKLKKKPFIYRLFSKFFRDERAELVVTCAQKGDYDQAHLALLKDAYDEGESLDLLKHLVQMERRKEDAEDTRKWLRQRQAIVRNIKK